MKKIAIIVAGGSGLRMGSELPKQFLLLNGRPVLMHTLEQFKKAIPDIHLILVLPDAHFDYWMELCSTYKFRLMHEMVIGGGTRFHSVKNGLDSIKEPAGIVAIHDGVRPLVSIEAIQEAFEQAAEFKTAILSVASKDSVRVVEGMNNQSIAREKVRLIQTPQCFELGLIKKAFEQDYNGKFTDDASVAEAAGFSIHLVEGHYENIKITTPEDLVLAELLIKKKTAD
jgi:2-C-methyl-D-erythritol 4-phosphate cytidylyltransferase